MKIALVKIGTQKYFTTLVSAFYTQMSKMNQFVLPSYTWYFFLILKRVLSGNMGNVLGGVLVLLYRWKLLDKCYFLKTIKMTSQN